MKKLLLALLCFLSVSHSTFAACNKEIYVRNCPNFIKDKTALKQAFMLAILISDFKNARMEEHTYQDVVFGYRAVTDKGFASVFSCSFNNSCVIEFYCVDDSCDYDMFLSVYKKILPLFDVGAMLSSS